VNSSSTSESWKTRVRRVLARGIRVSGIGDWAARTRPVELPILTYHRVLPEAAAAAYPFGGMTMPLDQFEAQMAHLAARYKPLGIGEALRLLASGDLDPRAVVVTFDDGYRDNFEHAYPVLERLGIQATFFVVTGALDGAARLWWDEVADLTAAMSRRRGTGSDTPSLPGHWDSLIGGRGGAVDHRIMAQRLVGGLNAAPRTERLRILSALRECAGPEPRSGESAMMTWDQARTMSRSGHTIGAHTVTHAFLDELDEGEARAEIERSIARVAEAVGRPARFFSYPRGRVSAQAKRLLEEAGIVAAVTTDAGRNRRGADPFALRRLDAGHVKLRAGFDPAVFEAELQGWFQALRGGAGSAYPARDSR
jgi:peptidoglycan/xylan/chitin deacetylase (PgdA/CDA1 family)